MGKPCIHDILKTPLAIYSAITTKKGGGGGGGGANVCIVLGK